MTQTISVTREQLLEERAAILGRYDTTLEEFTGRADGYRLVGDEWQAWERLRDIAFLLGDDCACSGGGIPGRT